MKPKIYFGFVLFVLFLSCIAFASAAGIMTAPHPIGGHVYNGQWKGEGIQVEIKDLNTAEVAYVSTDSNGFYMMDVGNFKIAPFPLCYGHKLRLTACSGDSRCVQEITVNGDGGQTNIDFYIPSTATVIWKGIAIVIGTLIAILAAVKVGTVIYKRRKGFSDKVLAEMLQNAQNVAIGKLKDVADQFEAEDIQFLKDYEKANKNRPKVIAYLKTL